MQINNERHSLDRRSDNWCCKRVLISARCGPGVFYSNRLKQISIWRLETSSPYLEVEGNVSFLAQMSFWLEIGIYNMHSIAVFLKIDSSQVVNS